MEGPSTPTRSSSRYARARTPPSPTHGPVLQEYEPYSPRRSSRNVGNPYSTQNLSSSKPASSHIPPLHTPKRPAFAFTPAELFPRSPPADNGNASLLNTPHDNKKGLGLLDPSSSSSGRKPNTMLLTPSKTPTMTPSRKHNRTASVENTARILHFQPDDPNDVMPPRHNKYKQRTSIRAASMHGLDLDGDDFSEPDRTANPSFEVYAESHARVPQLDDSEENPFYRPRAATVPTMRSSPRRTRKTAEQLAEEQRMDDAASRDEGLVYMFRGKKVFREFGDITSDSETHGNTTTQRALKRSAGATASRPLTRSAIQPRLLFPSVSRDDVDEEAETDLEVDSDASLEGSRQSNSALFEIPATPAKTESRAAPMLTPPTTARASRKRTADAILPQQSSKKKRVDINPIPSFQGEPTPADGTSSALTSQPSSRKREKAAPQLTPIVEGSPEPSSSAGSTASQRKTKSPFDNWPRTKKRDAEPSQSTAKRTRSSMA